MESITTETYNMEVTDNFNCYLTETLVFHLSLFLGGRGIFKVLPWEPLVLMAHL
jgi:hypothetical protein